MVGIVDMKKTLFFPFVTKSKIYDSFDMVTAEYFGGIFQMDIFEYTLKIVRQCHY